MEALPIISCIMPTYGRPDYVNESVAMFLAQDYLHKELIILNDCVGQQYAGDFPNVRIINQNSRFSSLGEKRNACIRLAKGSVIAIWDDDDVYLPWRLSFCWSEMDRLGTAFYRPAEFWAYWGDEQLHDNQCVPSWMSHAWSMFTRELWEKVGGYPDVHIGEDAQFFERIHWELREAFIKYGLAREDRFGILRGTSQYQHMSIGGGKHPLDINPGNYRVTPAEIGDPILRAAHDCLIAAHTHSHDPGSAIARALGFGRRQNPHTPGGMVANRMVAADWEKFMLMTLTDEGSRGKVAILAHTGYLAAEDGGGGSTYANRSAIGPWEKWEIIKHGDGSVSFKSIDGHYFVAEEGGGSFCGANRSQIGEWERFRLEFDAAGRVSIKTVRKGLYVSAQP
jgi:hypothetical protein